MFLNHSVPSPICTVAFSSFVVTCIFAVCSSFPLSNICAVYLPSFSSITFPFTFTDAIVLSVDFFTIFTWYVTSSPFSDITFTSNTFVSLDVATVFINVCVDVSPFISTVAASLVVTTSIEDSSTFFSMYFVYVFVFASNLSGVSLFTVITQLVSFDFLSISNV